MKKPIIGINGNLTKDGRYSKLSQEYSRAVLKAGGSPVILPSLPLAGNLPEWHGQVGGILERILDSIDGLLLSGGHDLSPALYGEKILNKKVILLPEVKQRFDLALTKAALKRKTPILGTCYGAQLINVALGGALFQDIRSQIKSAIGHKKSYHKVYLCEGTLLHRILGRRSIITNSFHHQSIKTLGRNLIISARAEDGIIEGVELPNSFCLGLQWHPERMMDIKEQVGLLRAFIQYAAR
ncbi:MAG TPA: gamma-glutamyl-gamma-aminobutyrate hydrolase family protein [Planctomycetota bacterium]|nr:gamma-glutamyl-gamma-aminobutyrate hydrolase family protein [Planctomycetota bacterium]